MGHSEDGLSLLHIWDLGWKTQRLGPELAQFTTVWWLRPAVTREPS